MSVKNRNVMTGVMTCPVSFNNGCVVSGGMTYSVLCDNENLMACGMTCTLSINKQVVTTKADLVLKYFFRGFTQNLHW